MTNKELMQEIAKRVDEIRKLYCENYPNGDYLSIVIYKDSTRFSNSNWKGGKDENVEDDLTEILEGDEQ